MQSERARYRLGVAVVAGSTVALSSGGIFTKLLPFDAWTIVAWRGIFAVLFVGAVVVWRYRGRTAAMLRRLVPAAILPTLFTLAAITLFIPAFQRTSVAHAFTIYVAVPFIAAMAAWAWLGERPSRATLVASLGALVGMIVMVGPGAEGSLAGDFLALGGTTAAALLTVSLRQRRDIDMLPIAALANFLAVLIAVPLAGQLLEPGPRDILVAAAFGFFTMTLGLMLFVVGAPLIPSALAALINAMEAPAGAFLAWLVIGETPDAATWLGGGIMLASVVGRLALDLRKPAPEGR